MVTVTCLAPVAQAQTPRGDQDVRTGRPFLRAMRLGEPGAPGADAQQAPAPALPPVTAGPDGIAIQSPDGDFRLQFGLLLHAEGRFAIDDEQGAVVDTFAVRRLRPYMRGRFARRFEFYLNPDFAGGTLVVQDAYLDTSFSPAFRVRMGKGKTPFGMERLHPASNLLFFERAMPTAIVPNRDVGVQVLGDVAGGTVSYLAGVMNGVNDGGSADLDTADSKEIAGRVVVRPFARRPAASPLRGLAVAMAGTRGGQTGAAALPVYRSQSLAQPYFSYSGAVADGTRVRFSPQAFYYHKAIGAFAEYVRSTVPVAEGGVREDIGHAAWQIAGSYVLTGESATDAGSGVRPRANFDFGNGNWGAFQVAARYHTLTVDEAARTLGFAAAGASLQASAWTVGLNWYLTPNVRYVFNVERTVFDDEPDGPRPAENALVFRMQLSF